MTSPASLPNINASPEPVPHNQPADSFFRSLLDTSFTTFIVPKLIRFLYIFFMVVGALVSLAVTVRAFDMNFGFGMVALLLSPIVFLLVLIQARITLELIAIVFRIEHNTARLRPGTN